MFALTIRYISKKASIFYLTKKRFKVKSIIISRLYVGIILNILFCRKNFRLEVIL